MPWDGTKATKDVIKSSEENDRTKVIQRGTHTTHTDASIDLGAGNYIVLGRFELPAGWTAKVHTSQLNPSGVTGLNIVLRDVTNAVDVYSNNSGFNQGQDLAESQSGATVEARIDNASGSLQTVKGGAKIEIGDV